MKLSYLEVSTGPRIPVKIAMDDDCTLLECREASAFLKLTPLKEQSLIIPEEGYLRAVFIPGEGAYLQIFDAFGSLNREDLHIPENEALQILGSIV